MIGASSFLEPGTEGIDAAWATFLGLLADNGGHPASPQVCLLRGRII